MKKLLLSAIILATSSMAMAKPIITPMQFTKGSTCGYFEGNVTDRVLTLNLKNNQSLTIEMKSDQPIDIIVKDPKGKRLKDTKAFSEMPSFLTKNKGKHQISFVLSDPVYPYAEIKVCAYSE